MASCYSSLSGVLLGLVLVGRTPFWQIGSALNVVVAVLHLCSLACGSVPHVFSIGNSPFPCDDFL